MNKEEYRSFVRKTESLAKPEDVTAISFLGDFNRILPKRAQDAVMEKGNKKIPYMGFIVDPYCTFLAYRIKNIETAQAMLPEGYELAETSLFKGEQKQPLIIFSAFTARTSAFIGMRLEMYIIARHTESGLLSWIIADYVTNTNSHDPKNGFCGYSSDKAVFTTTPYGEVVVDVKSRSTGEELSLTAEIQSGTMTLLDEELWIEGNLSVDYGGKLKEPGTKPFGLIFDPVLMKEALRVPLDRMQIQQNSYMSDLIGNDSPVSAAIFPFSQHFIIKQNMKRTELMKEPDLHPLIQDFLDRSGFKTMKGEDLKKPILRGMIVSTLFNYGLILFLLFKLFSA
ncbi:hypothetical protein [Spirochaeta dissipatitropha]